MNRRSFLTLFTLALFAIAPMSSATAADSSAMAAVKAQIAKAGQARQLIDEPQLFLGDFSGDGQPDAVAFYQTTIPGAASGFNSNIMALQRMPDGSFQLVQNLGEQVAADVRDVRITVGRIEYTHTVWKPTDPHCCPTGTKRSSITLKGFKDAVPAPKDERVDAQDSPTPGKPKKDAKPKKAEPGPSVTAPTAKRASTDDATRAAFQQFIKTNMPQSYWQSQGILDQMTAAQMLAIRGPVGRVYMADGQPNIGVLANREGNSDKGEYCREFRSEVFGAPFFYVGCRSQQNDGPWHFLH